MEQESDRYILGNWSTDILINLKVAFLQAWMDLDGCI